jgi:lysophospholipase L1-like esterase
MRETPTVARAAQIYQFLAYQTFNIALLLLAINLLLAVLFFVYDYTKSGADTRVVSYRERFADYQAYTRITKPEIDTYLDEQDAFGSVGFVYAPWVQFRAPEFRGKYLNTDARGFRRTTAPKSSGGNPLKVHVYGGSTTFGYGVPDDHTIPSYLQRQLDQESGGRAVLVKNFGIGFYYSSQEQQLLLTALKDGDVPDWAIFIDGGNDTAQLSLRHDEPIFTPAMKRAWAGLSVGRQGARLEWIPMVRLANGLAHRLGLAPQSSPAGGLQHQTIKSDAHLSQDEKDAIAAYLTKRYTQNMHAYPHSSAAIVCDLITDTEVADGRRQG